MDRNKTNTHLRYGQLISICAAMVVVRTALAEPLTDTEMEQVTSTWECQWCPYEEEPASRGEAEAGVGYVSNDSFKHGDYTGLDDKGGYVIAGGEYTYRGTNGTYTDVEADDLGLDSRRIAAEGGKQGNIEGTLTYSELPKLNLDTARTPYSVGVNQTLPPGWVTDTDTSGMSALASALHLVDIATQRDTLDLAATYHQTKSLSYGLNFQRTTKEGYRAMSLAIGGFVGGRSAILAVPVDYVTDQGEARISYRKARWQANLSYQFSNFDNDANTLRWENAFSSPAGVTEGQAALEPDNTMQRFSLSGNYRFNSSTKASALLSLGRLEQNDSFLPYEVGGSTAALPRNSLDGKINTFVGNITMNTQVTEQIDLQARYRQNEQDNETPRATYTYVIADNPATTGSARTNIPYGFRQRELSLEGGYQIQKQDKVNAGISFEEYDRTYQEVDTTEENTLWGSYRKRQGDQWEWFVRLAARSRSGDQYTPFNSPPFPVEDPLLRKYNMADRDRRQVSVSVSYMPQQAIQLTLFTDYANDDYSNSSVGLTESEQINYGFDVQYQYSDVLAFNADFTITNMDSKQAGTAWTADNDDDVSVIHIGTVYVVTRDKIKVGLDYTYADSEGDMSVSSDPYPTLTSTRHTFKLYGDYRINKRSVLRLTYHFEDYEENNWAIDGVAPNTIDNVLTMGEVSPDYSIGVLGVSVRYTLD